MIQGDIDKTTRVWRIAAVTPAGRKCNLEILKKYIFRDMAKGLIDEWQLWVNTDNKEDIKYIYELAKEDKKIKVFEVDGIIGHWGYTIANFFKFANNLNTVYIRFDDDICFIEEQAVERLARARLQNSWVNDDISLQYFDGSQSTPEPFVVSANVVNNTLMSAIHQEIGALGKEAGTQTRIFHNVELLKPDFYNLTHETFKNKLENNKLSDYYFPDMTLSDFQHFSINCLAFFAKDLMFSTDIMEESYIWGKAPKRLGRPNMICGDALVVHQYYGSQRAGVNEDLKNKWYEYYKQLSEKIK